MSSLFGDLDLQQFDDDPWSIPDDTYEATVSNVEVARTNAETKLGMTIQYTITSGNASGQLVTEWKRVPERNNPQADDNRAGAFLKQRLLSFGIPESRLNEVKPDDLIGLDVYITTRTGLNKKNGQKVVNVANVQLKDSGPVSGTVTPGVGNQFLGM
jgi:hypothetical protein